jgi:endonuclease YncB( thermonuclease family)
LKRVGFTVAALLASSAWAAGERCVAIDGTTLRCGSERVLVEGIKAPQQGEPGAEAARQRLQRRIQSGEVVIQRKGQDKHGRTLGRVFVNGNRVTQVDVTPQKRN